MLDWLCADLYEIHFRLLDDNRSKWLSNPREGNRQQHSVGVKLDVSPYWLVPYAPRHNLHDTPARARMLNRPESSAIVTTRNESALRYLISTATARTGAFVTES